MENRLSEIYMNFQRSYCDYCRHWRNMFVMQQRHKQNKKKIFVVDRKIFGFFQKKKKIEVCFVLFCRPNIFSGFLKLRKKKKKMSYDLIRAARQAQAQRALAQLSADSSSTVRAGTISNARQATP